MKKMFSQGLYTDKADLQKRSVFDKLPAFDPDNVQTYFDISIGDEPAGRVVFELFTK